MLKTLGSIVTAKKPSALYKYIETLQGERPWGSVLDAGTGVNSLSWVQSLATERWTAVTGAKQQAERVQNAVQNHPQNSQRPQDRIALGNWVDPDFLKGETYDTVLADYLLGAIEGFAPYLQSYLFSRLKPLTKDALYVTGLEPYVPISRPETEDGHILWELGRFRDACVLMAGGNPYREYPAQWAIHHLELAGFEVHALKHFKVSYKSRFVKAQIEIARQSLAQIDDKALAKALSDKGAALQAKALEHIAQHGALRHCRNYVIAARVGG